ncbi:MAG TPA: hypothetical protein VGL25_18935 [Casimicrobiaceae bacterium]|jgi:uncharacterized membrane protein
MRLWKRGPTTFGVLALATLLIDFALSMIPGGGILLAQIAVPLAACGLLYASLAADRGGRPRLGDFAAIAGAAPGAMLAVIASGVIVFATEALTAYAIGRVNMLNPDPSDASLAPGVMLAVYAVGIAVSLPLTFVPFGALFDGLSLRASFAQSIRGFAANIAPMALYGVLSLALLLFGWATFGVGLLLALPWWAASSYAAWKDIFDVDRGLAPPR